MNNYLVAAKVEFNQTRQCHKFWNLVTKLVPKTVISDESMISAIIHLFNKATVADNKLTRIVIWIFLMQTLDNTLSQYHRKPEAINNKYSQSKNFTKEKTFFSKIIKKQNNITPPLEMITVPWMRAPHKLTESWLLVKKMLTNTI